VISKRQEQLRTDVEVDPPVAGMHHQSWTVQCERMLEMINEYERRRQEGVMRTPPSYDQVVLQSAGENSSTLENDVDQ